MKILVTGSQGFIGKELVKELKKEKNEVIEFDLIKGQNLLNEKHLEMIKGIETVIHLAAELDENKSIKELNEINVNGTEKLLEKCVEFKVKKFIYLSTAGVMGNISKQADESTELNPLTKYEKSKAEAEKKVNEFQELIPITVLRSALVLGPNRYWKQIVSLIKKDFPLIGNGENKFQIIYYKDLVSAIIFCLKKFETENETFIVAEEKGKKLILIYSLIQNELGIKKKIKIVPVFLAKIFAFTKLSKFIRTEHINRFIRNRDYSTQKINKLGWTPKYSTEQSIHETIIEIEKQEKK